MKLYVRRATITTAAIRRAITGNRRFCVAQPTGFPLTMRTGGFGLRVLRLAVRPGALSQHTPGAPPPPRGQMPDLGRPTKNDDAIPLFDFDVYFLGTWTFEWDLPDGSVLVLEVDGAFHDDVLQAAADKSRHRKLSTRKHIVLSCSAYELRYDPRSVMEDLIALGVPRTL